MIKTNAPVTLNTVSVNPKTVVFARKNGISIWDLLTLINNSALGNTFIRIKGEAILKNNFKAAFALKHIVKDLGLAKDLGLVTPMGETVAKTFQDAKSDFGEEDIIAIIRQIGV